MYSFLHLLPSLLRRNLGEGLPTVWSPERQETDVRFDVLVSVVAGVGTNIV